MTKIPTKSDASPLYLYTLYLYTKIATRVLKDGDLVEVDADKGIIRIIKKV